MRGNFHKAELKEWIERYGDEAVACHAIGQFESTSSQPTFVYDLPLEEFCKRLKAAVEAAFDSPVVFKEFLFCVAGRDNAGSVDLVLSSPTDHDVCQMLMRRCEWRIDAFQIDTGNRWRRHLGWIVLGICSMFGLSFMASVISYGLISFIRALLFSAVVTVAAAFFAMFFRDLVAIVELKRRP